MALVDSEMVEGVTTISNDFIHDVTYGANYSVIFENSSHRSKGREDVEAIGVDNEKVFYFMYSLSIGGYIVNATLFFTIFCRQKFRRATNYLLANLCICSILFLMAVNLRIVERTHGPLWKYTKINCMVWSVLRRIPQAVASLTIVAISCDRSQAARMVVVRRSSADMTKRILRIWLVGILTTLPRGFLFRFRPEEDTSVVAYKCSPIAVGPYGIINFLYAFFHLMCIFMLPMCILVCDIYSTVQKIVFLKSRQQIPMNHHVHEENTQEPQQITETHKKQLQLLRNSCVFAALFLVGWLPWGIYQNLGDLPKTIVPEEFRRSVWTHFRNVRYLPFSVTAFLPLLLVVCTYDSNAFTSWRRCCLSDEPNNRPPPVGENYRPNYIVRGGAPAPGMGQRVELLNNGPGIAIVNNINHHPPQNV